MVAVELVSYKIAKLNMVNNISDSGILQLENAVSFDVKYKQDNRMAVAVLTEYVKHREKT